MALNLKLLPSQDIYETGMPTLDECKVPRISEKCRFLLFQIIPKGTIPCQSFVPRLGTNDEKFAYAVRRRIDQSSLRHAGTNFRVTESLQSASKNSRKLRTDLLIKPTFQTPLEKSVDNRCRGASGAVLGPHVHHEALLGYAYGLGAQGAHFGLRLLLLDLQASPAIEVLIQVEQPLHESGVWACFRLAVQEKRLENCPLDEVTGMGATRLKGLQPQPSPTHPLTTTTLTSQKLTQGLNDSNLTQNFRQSYLISLSVQLQNGNGRDARPVVIPCLGGANMSGHSATSYSMEMQTL